MGHFTLETAIMFERFEPRLRPDQPESPRIHARQQVLWKKGGMCQRSRDARAVPPRPRLNNDAVV
jgi:hypothetical protein